MKLLRRSFWMMWARALLVGLAGTASMVGMSGIAFATPGAPGTVDESWANLSPFGSGKLVTAVTANFDQAYAVAIQTDNKIVVAGSCGNYFCAVRYLPDGGSDSSFNSTGSVTTQIGASGAQANAVAIQADGKIVLGGWCIAVGTIANFCAVRYNADGSLDSAFNGTGKVITAIDNSTNQRATAMAIQSDGKIVLAGWCGPSFCVVRYLSNGSLDTGFNSTGKVVTPSTGRANVMAIQADGKIVLAGTCGSVICAVRYNVNGSIDINFSSAAGISEAMAIAIQADGKIVLSGQCNSFCAARYNVDGSLDSGFNGTGTVFTPVSAGVSSSTAVAIQPDGRLVLAGSCESATSVNGSDFDFCIARYNSDGSLNSGFGFDGKTITPVAGSRDLTSAMAIQADGKIMLAGSCTVGSNGLGKFCTVRFEGGPFAAQNCKLDIDGDNRVLLTTDSLIHMRIALGMTGNEVIGGITFPNTATRKTWPAIRTYLVSQCGMSLPL